MAADVLPLRPALPSVSLVQAINNKKMMLHLHGSADETDGRDGSWDERSVVAALISIYGGDHIGRRRRPGTPPSSPRSFPSVAGRGRAAPRRTVPIAN